jgi:ribosomal protein S12 methylthiotransferase accessory factor
MPDLGRITGGICSRGTGGTALVEDVALAKAIGESVERYCGDLFDETQVLYAPYREIKEEATDPQRFVLFHPDQYNDPDFPFNKITEDTVIGWVKGFSLTRNQPTYVPASLVHLGHQPPTLEEYFELGPVSGYACGNTTEEALLGAICEVVERDAFMVFWYNLLPVPGFDLNAAKSEALRQTLDRYHSTPVQLFCSNITTDIGIPAALAVMVSHEPGWPAAIVATAANLDPERAITRALQELSANHLYIRGYFQNPYHPAPSAPHEIMSQEDHGLFYCSHERLPALDTILRPRWMQRPGDVTSHASDDVKANVDFCVAQLAAVDLEVIAIDLTTSDVAELGFKVFKVLVPGIQPIDFGMQWPHVGGRRLYEAPVRMGYRNTPAAPHELNYFPHPFP